MFSALVANRASKTAPITVKPAIFVALYFGALSCGIYAHVVLISNTLSIASDFK